MNRRLSPQRGSILIVALVFGGIATFFVGGLVHWGVQTLSSVKIKQDREEAFQIAEAGIEYYRWHLAHAPLDFRDGTATSGPYLHTYRDKDGNAIGGLSLRITPPQAGSTVVTVESTGYTYRSSRFRRMVRAQLAKPSLARYAVVANSHMRFGGGTEIFGPIHSNGGVRFDGVAHNTISSALASYVDPDHGGPPEFGVHTHVPPVDPLPPRAVPSRPSIFRAERRFPVPAVDFTGLTADLSQLRAHAQAAGRYFANSGTLGYHLVLRTDQRFELYRVTSLVPQRRCPSPTWSIRRREPVAGSPFTNPANGVIYVEDNLWLDGTVSATRLTVASGRFPENPSTNTSIAINENLIYTYLDGTDALGIIAQKDINVGLLSANVLTVHGALVAKNGRVGRPYYNARCGPSFLRSTITLLGTLITNQRYGFAYTDGTGYRIRNLNYDGNLLYGPPPSFPLASDQYTMISWREVFSP